MCAGGCNSGNNGTALHNIGGGVDGGRKLISDLAQIYTRGYGKVIRNTGLRREPITDAGRRVAGHIHGAHRG